MAASNDKMLRDAFQAFDTDKSGTIDLNELKCVVKRYFELSKETADDKKITDVSTVSSGFATADICIQQPLFFLS